MARPRKDQVQPDARTRIINAFWDMLAEGPFDSITVKGLASRAQVNHNTIYRHFDSLGHVAKSAVSEVYSLEAARQVLTLFAHPGLIDVERIVEQGLDERFNKVILAMRSGSPMLVETIQDSIKECWMQITGTSWDSLPDETKLELSFILGGITSMLRSFNRIEDFVAAKAIATSRIGIAARKTLAELSCPGDTFANSSGGRSALSSRQAQTSGRSLA